MRDCILFTDIPSPYMVEFIEAVNVLGRWKIIPLYDKLTSPGRAWNRTVLHHDHIVLNQSKSARKETIKLISKCELVVTGKLWGKNTRFILEYQQRHKKPLVIWAERPGAVRRNIIAATVRRIAIGRRFSDVDAVWGIGKWAVEEYRKSLPNVRQFENMPYASNLNPYFAIRRESLQGAASRGIRILYSGSLIYRKGVDLLIKSFIRLLKKGFQATLTLMGKGELDLKLKSLATPEYNEFIKFIDFQDWIDLPAIYTDHDLLVAPSRYDGWGLTVVEGLAAGMPVIATDMMGASLDFIKDGENGWMIPSGNEELLYEALCEAMTADLFGKGLAARRSVSSWCLEKAATRWCNLADGALNGAIVR